LCRGLGTDIIYSSADAMGRAAGARKENSMHKKIEIKRASKAVIEFVYGGVEHVAELTKLNAVDNSQLRFP